MSALVAVVAEFHAPLVSVRPVHLDSLLEIAWFRQQGREETPDRLTPLSEISRAPIPIRYVDDVALCTAALHPPVQGLTHHTRRRDAVDVDRLAMSFTPSLGPGRDRLRRILQAPTPFALWLGVLAPDACVGDVEVLVQSITHVGGERGTGHGFVSAWHVVGYEGEASSVLTYEGTALRHLPYAWVTSSRPASRGAFASPYWHPARQTAVCFTGDPAELRGDVRERLASC